MGKRPSYRKLGRTPSVREPLIPPNQQAFAANLQKARNAAQLTQAELATRSGISQPHISQLEAGTWEPRLTTIMALAKALRVEPAELLPTSYLEDSE